MKISFCITSRNRLRQLEKTLEKNLALIGNHEIALVNYGCEQGLDRFIEQFTPQIQSGILRYFSVTGISQFHAAKAKNLSHRLATGDILFNLDGDNFISADLIQKTVNLFKLHPYSILHAAHIDGSTNHGTCGRIALHRDNFYHLGGYDEALLPMGAQDTNLIERGVHLGLPYFFVPCDAEIPIANTIADKAAVSQGKQVNNYQEMNRQGKVFGRLKMIHEGACRRFNFATYAGILNFQETLIVDGHYPAVAPILPDSRLCEGESLPRWIAREITQNHRHNSGFRGWLKNLKPKKPEYHWALNPIGRAIWKND